MSSGRAAPTGEMAGIPAPSITWFGERGTPATAEARWRMLAHVGRWFTEALDPPEPGTIDDETFTLMEEVATRLALNLANARLRERLVEHRAAEEATRYRDEILAAVSHDMKTPLAVLLGFVDMLEQSGRDHDPVELEEVHRTIGRQVRRLRRLTTQFLDYVRTEAGHELSLSLRPVDPERLVRAVTFSLPDSGRVEVDIADPLPPVLADESRLDLALANLASNA